MCAHLYLVHFVVLIKLENLYRIFSENIVNINYDRAINFWYFIEE